MPPKRANPSRDNSGRPTKKTATGSKKASTSTKKALAGAKKAPPRLKKSTQPEWNKPEYSDEKPSGKWGKKCVERWCLLSPYDTSITDDQWKTYYHERSALDNVNSVESDNNKMVVSEDLCDDTWEQLRFMSGNVAAAIFGSVLDDEHKKRIGRTLLGSLYLVEFSGTDEGNVSPREVRSMTRLYSPFGLGTSIDLYYIYYVRTRIVLPSLRFGSLDVIASTISDCNAETPRWPRTLTRNRMGYEVDAPGTRTVFGWDEDLSKITTAAKIKDFEEPLFGCKGWLSPLKLTHIFFAAAGVMDFNEAVVDVAKSTLAKFKLFQGENDGKDMLKQELEKFAQLEKELGEDMNCVPQRLLLLAQHEMEVVADTGAKTVKGRKESKKV
ncbi:hypothetical protein FRC09_012393 [Ceratobasidium sp. 395]|nr:hypothetical protein FRC09_012393 [Ceratobasidium sp. 395]